MSLYKRRPCRHDIEHEQHGADKNAIKDSAMPIAGTSDEKIQRVEKDPPLDERPQRLEDKHHDDSKTELEKKAIRPAKPLAFKDGWKERIEGWIARKLTDEAKRTVREYISLLLSHVRNSPLAEFAKKELPWISALPWDNYLTAAAIALWAYLKMKSR